MSALSLSGITMTKSFERSWATPPGELLRDAIEDGACLRESARDALGLGESDFEAFLGGCIAVSSVLADKLAALLGGTPNFWLDMDAQYRCDLMRLAPKTSVREEVGIMPRIKQGVWSVAV